MVINRRMDKENVFIHDGVLFCLKGKLEAFVGKRMQLENIMLNQKEKLKYLSASLFFSRSEKQNRI